MTITHAEVVIAPNGYFKARAEAVGANLEELVAYGEGTLEPERAKQIQEALFAAANRLTLTPCYHSC